MLPSLRARCAGCRVLLFKVCIALCWQSHANWQADAALCPLAPADCTLLTRSHPFCTACCRPPHSADSSSAFLLSSKCSGGRSCHYEAVNCWFPSAFGKQICKIPREDLQTCGRLTARNAYVLFQTLQVLGLPLVLFSQGGMARGRNLLSFRASLQLPQQP